MEEEFRFSVCVCVGGGGLCLTDHWVGEEKKQGRRVEVDGDESGQVRQAYLAGIWS